MTTVTQLTLTNPVAGGTVRGSDRWGDGHFGAQRGSRRHNGVDIVALPGDDVLSPMEALVVRLAYPYDDDFILSGVLLQGLGAYAGLEAKLFYLLPDPALLGHSVAAGQRIGAAQSLQHRYPGITDHIHLEVRRAGEPIDPCALIAALR